MTSPDSPSPRTDLTCGFVYQTASPYRCGRREPQWPHRPGDEGFHEYDPDERRIGAPDRRRVAQEAPAPDGLRAAIERAYEEHGHNDDWGVRVIYLDGLLKALAAAPPSPAEPPRGTKLVLVSDELMDVLAEPTDESAVAWAWGEPDEHGWYTPTFTRHHRAEARPPEGLDELEQAVARPMTSPDSPSPRTEAGKPFTFERWLAAVHEDHNGLIWTTKDELRAVFEHEFHAEAAQEAPAPEGLRQAILNLRTKSTPKGRFFYSHLVDRDAVLALLDPAPPSPAEPPLSTNGWNVHPATTALPTDDDPEAGMPYRVLGVEARPPEGLDAAWAAAEAALEPGRSILLLRPGILDGWEVYAGVPDPPDDKDYGYGPGKGDGGWGPDYGEGPTPAAALLALAARLSARGAEPR